MKVYSYVTGECFEPDAESKHAQRMARLRNRVWWGVQNVSRETSCMGGQMIMITLTYRTVAQWRPTQISEWVTWWRESYNRGYVWVAELQKRGAMHYHFLSSLGDGDVWDKARYDAEWYHGYTWVTPSVRRPFYLMKYLQKEYQKNGKQYPKGARIIGYSRTSHYLCDRENNIRMASRYPSWIQGGMDEEERETLGAVGQRVRGGISFGGKLAISPYGTAELPSIAEVGEWMLYNIVNGGKLVE